MPRPRRTRRSWRNPTLLADWEREEHDREDRARANGGAYYPPTALQDAYDRLVTETVVSAQLRAQVDDLHGQLDAVRGDPLVSRLTKLRASRLAGELRNAPVVGPLCMNASAVVADRDHAPPLVRLLLRRSSR